jgi:hypothetical protein
MESAYSTIILGETVSEAWLNVPVCSRPRFNVESAYSTIILLGDV